MPYSPLMNVIKLCREHVGKKLLHSPNIKNTIAPSEVGGTKRCIVQLPVVHNLLGDCFFSGKNIAEPTTEKQIRNCAGSSAIPSEERMNPVVSPHQVGGDMYRRGGEVRIDVLAHLVHQPRDLACWRRLVW